MPRPADNGGPYEVLCSDTIVRALEKIQDQANQEERGQQALQAFRYIARRLSLDPFDFGEPIYRLPALRLQVCCAVFPPLIVHFAVCDDRPVVFIKGVELLAKPRP